MVTYWFTIHAFYTQNKDAQDDDTSDRRKIKGTDTRIHSVKGGSDNFVGAKDSSPLHMAAGRIFGIPDFCHYALADGIKNVFKRVGNGPFPKKPPKKQIPGTHYQLSIFDI